MTMFKIVATRGF